MPVHPQYNRLVMWREKLSIDHAVQVKIFLLLLMEQSQLIHQRKYQDLLYERNHRGNRS
jgi:hypothetical protein